MIQATVAIADFMMLLVEAAFWVTIWAAGWTLLGVAILGGAFLILRSAIRRLRRS